MQKKEIEKNWNLLRMSVQKHWNKLTSEDLYMIDGMYDKFVERLAKRYGYTREIAERELENWEPELKQGWNQVEPKHESSHTKQDREMWKSQGNRKEKIHEWQGGHEEPKKKPEAWQNPSDTKHKKRKAG